jgi:GAF domain-containing protein
MQRHGGSSRPPKGRRTNRAKTRKAPIGPASNAGLQERVAALTRELKESRDHQMATGEILASLTGGIADANPVFEAIVRSLRRLFDTRLAVVQVLKDGVVHLAAAGREEYETLAKRFPRALDNNTGGGRAITSKQVVQFAPVLGNPAAPPTTQQFARDLGFNSAIFAPMMRGDQVIGSISTARVGSRPFDEREVALIKAFADQAVIAIENTRLLKELRESLQQQTATADVLKVISRSTFDLQTVLDTLVESAARLCHADKANIARIKNGSFQFAAFSGFQPDYNEYLKALQMSKIDRGSITGRTVLERRIVHIPDILADPEFTWFEAQKRGNYRTVLGVPLLREGAPIGVLFLSRATVDPFTQQQIDLVSTFADQAVIAIENVRLFEAEQQRTRELSESLEQQTATSEVLRVISSSQGQLQPVFDTLLDNATRLCAAKFGTMFFCEGNDFRVVAQHKNTPPALAQVRRQDPIVRAGPGTAVRRSSQTKQVVQVANIMEDKAYSERNPNRMALVELGGYRAILSVPMLKDNEVVGVINIYRQETGAFGDKQVELVKNFGSQAVIAIENARLLNELRERTDDLSKSLEDLRTTQDRLVQTQKLALLGQLTAGIAHEIKNPLNFINNFSGISAELIDELQDTLKGIPLDDRARTEINELTDTLKSNFDKVVHHGRRADAIVKNMLQHSREGSGEHRVIDINALVEESLNLAWHGARAETLGFEIKLKRSFDGSAGEADVFPQDIRRALLNVISNGFYAATKRRAETNGGDYEPTLTASTKNLGDRVEIRIRDNGTGMTSDVEEKIFNPFFTTKPTGEGTGLGLSISHDIIVKQHGGSIEVDTQLGEFTEIRVILPRVAVFV